MEASAEPALADTRHLCKVPGGDVGEVVVLQKKYRFVHVAPAAFAVVLLLPQRQMIEDAVEQGSGFKGACAAAAVPRLHHLPEQMKEFGYMYYGIGRKDN